MKSGGAWDPEQARAWLESIAWRGVYLGLERVGALAARLGNPERAFPAVLIAGTNGKGSVAAIVESILRAAAVRAGRYTSPHLLDWTERITVAGRPIDWAALARALQAVAPAAEELEATPFEAFTAAAMWHFRTEAITWAVVEVGLGGRLDATRLCDAAVTVVTSIGLDHIAELGSDPDAVAREKGAIMRSGVPAVFGAGTAPVRETLREQAGRIGARPYGAEELISVQACPDPAWGMQGEARWEGEAAELARRLGEPAEFAWRLPLAGFHMVSNLRTALAVIALLRARGIEVPTASLEAGISAVDWPGRMQLIPGSGGVPDLVLDVAHNPAAAEAVARSVSSALGSRPLWLVIALAGDKDLEGFLTPLLPLARGLVATRWAGERSRDPAEVAAAARRLAAAAGRALEIDTVPDPEKAVEAARSRLSGRGVVLATGSHMLVGPLLTGFAHRSAGAGTDREDRGIRAAGGPE